MYEIRFIYRRDLLYQIAARAGYGVDFTQCENRISPTDLSKEMAKD